MLYYLIYGQIFPFNLLLVAAGNLDVYNILFIIKNACCGNRNIFFGFFVF